MHFHPSLLQANFILGLLLLSASAAQSQNAQPPVKEAPAPLTLDWELSPSAIAGQGQKPYFPDPTFSVSLTHPKDKDEYKILCQGWWDGSKLETFVAEASVHFNEIGNMRAGRLEPLMNSAYNYGGQIYNDGTYLIRIPEADGLQVYFDGPYTATTFWQDGKLQHLSNFEWQKKSTNDDNPDHQIDVDIITKGWRPAQHAFGLINFHPRMAKNITLMAEEFTSSYPRDPQVVNGTASITLKLKDPFDVKISGNGYASTQGRAASIESILKYKSLFLAAGYSNQGAAFSLGFDVKGSKDFHLGHKPKAATGSTQGRTHPSVLPPGVR